MLPVIIGILILGLFFLGTSLRILDEYERGVVFRLGRLVSNPKGPGVVILIPLLERMHRVDTRTLPVDVPPQDVITRDNVSVKVNAVVYFRVVEPNAAVVQIENYLYATSQLAQTTLRSVCGEVELDDLLIEREKINNRLQEILDKATDPWGIKVSMVEIKHIDLPLEMQRAMARQAEAERERRAKVIAADGEFQAAEKLAQAAGVIGREPYGLQLRYLQTIQEIGADKNTTTVFPMPLEFLKAFAGKP